MSQELRGRLAQRVEILWISGYTWHDAPAIACILGIPEREVLELLPKRHRTA